MMGKRHFLLAGFVALVAPTGFAAAAAKETILHSFGINDAGPLSGMIVDANATFYGTTDFSGYNEGGTAFALAPGQSGYSETILHQFGGGTDGAKPGRLIADNKGNLYGVTLVGGEYGNGIIFKLVPGKSGYKEKILYNFTGGDDGGQPIGAVLGKGGAIIGVTQLGNSNCYFCGKVFMLAPSGGGYTESTLYSFDGGSGGNLPQAGVTIDSEGSIYGTTYYGGDLSCGNGGGCGIVFKLAYDKGTYAESLVYAFKAGSDGSNPYGVPSVDNRTGVIFGTTEYGGNGGNGNNGTVYMLAPSQGGYSETILHSFTGSGGFDPEGQPLIASNGRLYGTFALGDGGCSGIGCGGVYEIKRTRSGYAYKTIFAFRNPLKGAEPEQTNLLEDANGALYGTTRSGGSDTNCNDGGPGGVNGCGVAFKLVP